MAEEDKKHSVKITESEDKLTTYTEVDFQKIEHHDWQQQGDHIVCNSCPNRHGQKIPRGRILSKNDKGELVLLTRKEDEAQRQR